MMPAACDASVHCSDVVRLAVWWVVSPPTNSSEWSNERFSKWSSCATTCNRRIHFLVGAIKAGLEQMCAFRRRW